MSDAGLLLDSSAVLALLFAETGGDHVAAVLPGAAISSVNLSEVVAKMHDRGLGEEQVAANLTDLELTVIPFDQLMAERAGAMRVQTRAQGLSLGDRACLATAEACGRTVLTADRAWLAVDIGVVIEQLR